MMIEKWYFYFIDCIYGDYHMRSKSFYFQKIKHSYHLRSILYLRLEQQSQLRNVYISVFSPKLHFFRPVILFPTADSLSRFVNYLNDGNFFARLAFWYWHQYWANFFEEPHLLLPGAFWDQSSRVDFDSAQLCLFSLALKFSESHFGPTQIYCWVQ